jgi:hypothetical protein
LRAQREGLIPMPKRREAAPRRAPLLTLCVMHNGAALAVRPLPHKGDSQASSIVSATSFAAASDCRTIAI